METDACSYSLGVRKPHVPHNRPLFQRHNQPQPKIFGTKTTTAPTSSPTLLVVESHLLQTSLRIASSLQSLIVENRIQHSPPCRSRPIHTRVCPSPPTHHPSNTPTSWPRSPPRRGSASVLTARTRLPPSNARSASAWASRIASSAPRIVSRRTGYARLLVLLLS